MNYRGLGRSYPKFSFEDQGNIHIDDLNAELMEQLDFLRCKEDITVANFNLLLTELLKHPAVFSTYFENVLEVARKINDISALKKINKYLSPYI